MTREASVETLRRLAEAVDTAVRPGHAGLAADIVSDALAAYRAEIAPLRTRAEVDAEIVERVRLAERVAPAGAMMWDEMLRRDLQTLCREPTAPEAEPGESGTPETVRDIIRDWQRADPHLGNAMLRRLVTALENERTSGSPSASAAKESTDMAGADGGAANPESHACHPDERECNCNQALALKEQFARFVYYNFGGWLTNDADRETRWDEMRHLPEDVRARVDGYHAQRVATGEIPQWCKQTK